MGMTGGFAAMGVMTAASAYSAAEAAKTQSEFTQQQYEANEKFANMNAEDAVRRGDIDASGRKKLTRRQIGAQRAAGAASGLDVNFGSMADLQADTALAGGLDELTIKNNAFREAWGFKAQAQQYGSQGRMAGMAGANAYRNTLMSGAIQTADYGLRGYGKYKDNN